MDHLKRQLHEAIEHIDDIELLMEKKKLTDQKCQPAPVRVPEKEWEAVQLARQNVQDEETYTNDEVKAYFDEWLKKKS